MKASEIPSEKPSTNTDEVPRKETGSDIATGQAAGKSHEGAFIRMIGQKEVRKVKARRERGKGIWFGLGTMGMIGWSVAIPTLIGVAFGALLDSWYPGQISWTLTFLSIGLIIGCVNAWYWVIREQKGIHGEGHD
jgi:ATP synthase protein I